MKLAVAISFSAQYSTTRAIRCIIPGLISGPVIWKIFTKKLLKMNKPYCEKLKICMGKPVGDIGVIWA